MDDGDMKIEEAPSDEKVPEEQVYIDTYANTFSILPDFDLNTNKTHVLLLSLLFKQLTRVPIAVVEIPEDKENTEVWSQKSLFKSYRSQYRS